MPFQRSQPASTLSEDSRRRVRRPPSVTHKGRKIVVIVVSGGYVRPEESRQRDGSRHLENDQIGAMSCSDIEPFAP
jgi:hypothetical protein